MRPQLLPDAEELGQAVFARLAPARKKIHHCHVSLQILATHARASQGARLAISNGKSKNEIMLQVCKDGNAVSLEAT